MHVHVKHMWLQLVHTIPLLFTCIQALQSSRYGHTNSKVHGYILLMILYLLAVHSQQWNWGPLKPHPWLTRGHTHWPDHPLFGYGVCSPASICLKEQETWISSPHPWPGEGGRERDMEVAHKGHNGGDWDTGRWSLSLQYMYAPAVGRVDLLVGRNSNSCS